MPLPLRQVAWECGECATTNRGTEQLPSSCSYCRAENPRRYEILAGSAPAATARTVQVMRTEQHDIVRAASEARVAVVPRPVVDHALLAERLRGTLIDIVGTEKQREWEGVPRPRSVWRPACPGEQGTYPQGNVHLPDHGGLGGLPHCVCRRQWGHDVQGWVFAAASLHLSRG